MKVRVFAYEVSVLQIGILSLERLMSYPLKVTYDFVIQL